MNRTLSLALAVAASFASLPALAQTAAAPAAAPSATPIQAGPSKVAVIAFDQAVMNTNEGQRAIADINKKYEPQKAKIQTESEEIDGLQKKAQALPASAPDEQRTTLLREIDAKQKVAQRDAEDASNAYQGDIQEAYGKIAQKVGQSAVKYAQANGFTLMLNVAGNQQSPSPVLWAAESTDITQAVVNAYNAASGIAAPPPSAPTPTRRPSAPAAAPRK